MTVRTEYVDVDFKANLKKDLLENEVLCDRCKGTGLVVDGFAFDKQEALSCLRQSVEEFIEDSYM